MNAPPGAPAEGDRLPATDRNGRRPQRRVRPRPGSPPVGMAPLAQVVPNGDWSRGVAKTWSTAAAP
jgi:hypothetical protein